MLAHLSEWPEDERAVFPDLTIEGPIPSYSILPDSEMARRYMTTAIIDEIEEYVRMAGVSFRGQNSSPSSLARGSPQMSPGRTFTASAVF